MLNDKESKLLNSIVKYIDENGYSLLIRELRELLGIKPTSAVYKYLKRLEEKGYIERRENSPRALRVVVHN